MQDKEQFFDRWAPHYDALLTTVVYQAIHKRLLAEVELPQQPCVLDLGCGTGRLLKRLVAQFPTLRGTGLDLSAAMLRQARRDRHPHLIFIQGNAESLPFAEGQFDAVFNTMSFLHYPHPEQVLAEVSRVLRPGGCFYLADATFKIPIAYIPFSPGGLRLHTPQQREQLGKTVGLELVKHADLLGPVMLTIFTRSRE
ncbi:MAG: class I SAM-dependent methyltransferase [Cyanophyceae cyanobacterium]